MTQPDQIRAVVEKAQELASEEGNELKAKRQMVVGRRRALINVWPPVHLRLPVPAGATEEPSTNRLGASFTGSELYPR